MKMTGASMVINALKRENVSTVFGYPGGQILPLYDCLYDANINHILTRHEQGAVHAADGYARASGKPGVVFATSGPGATNLVTGIANAYMDSVPMVLFTGQVGTSFLGTDGFQEADITGITIPITKHNYLVREVEMLPSIIKEAFYIATTGRCGPVLIDIPRDIQIQEGRFHYPETVSIPGYNPTIEGHPGQVNRAVKAIQQAERPIIIGGGGIIASGASRQVKTLAEEGQIPVCLTLMGLGGFPGDHPLFLGMVGMHGTRAANLAIMESDLILAVGVRFDDRVTGKLEEFAPHAKVIHIDIDPAEIGKNIGVDIPIVGDLFHILDTVLSRFKPGNTVTWLAKIDSWKVDKKLFGHGGGLKPQEVIREIFRLTGGDAVITTDVGQHQMWTAQHYCFKKPRTLISSGGLGTMGYGFPAAIGAQFACPGSTVFCIAGDGSFQMNIQELATAVAYDVPVKVAIINNGCLGMVRQWQELFFNKRYSFSQLHNNPDFVRIAEAYGARGIRVDAFEQIEKAVKEALFYKGPVIIDFVVEPEENVFPMVGPNQPINEIMDS